VVHDRVLEIVVEDDAVPSNGQAPVGAGGFGIGLQNVKTRLVVQFADTAEFVAGPRPGGGFSVVMRFPIRVP
jgi:sensor histidine kinase YesM